MVVTEYSSCIKAMIDAVEAPRIGGYKVIKMYYRKGESKPYEKRTTEVL